MVLSHIFIAASGSQHLPREKIGQCFLKIGGWGEKKEIKNKRPPLETEFHILHFPGQVCLTGGLRTAAVCHHPGARAPQLRHQPTQGLPRATSGFSGPLSLCPHVVRGEHPSVYFQRGINVRSTSQHPPWGRNTTLGCGRHRPVDKSKSSRGHMEMGPL